MYVFRVGTRVARCSFSGREGQSSSERSCDGCTCTMMGVRAPATASQISDKSEVRFGEENQHGNPTKEAFFFFWLSVFVRPAKKEPTEGLLV